MFYLLIVAFSILSSLLYLLTMSDSKNVAGRKNRTISQKNARKEFLNKELASVQRKISFNPENQENLEKKQKLLEEIALIDFEIKTL